MWKQIVKNKIIVVIILALGALLVYKVTKEIGGAEDEKQKETSAGATAGRIKKKKDNEAGKVGGKALFDLALIQKEAPEFEKEGRNLFDYTQSPEELEALRRAEEDRQRRMEEEQRRREEERQRKMEEAKRRAEEQRRKREEEVRNRPPEPPKPKEPPKPQPPKVNYKYIGFIGPSEDRIAALLNREGKLLLGKREDVIEDAYKIVEVGYFEVKVGWVAFDGYETVFRD